MFLARCPTCQEAAQWVHPLAVTVLCSCGAALIREGTHVFVGGQFTGPPQGIAGLELGASGKWHGRPFRLGGLVRKGMDGARWNEWFLAFEDGSAGWLLDGDGRPRIFPDEPTLVQLSSPVGVGSAVGAWRVRRVGSARILAAKGELPFVLNAVVGRQVDLVAGDRPGTLDDTETPAMLFEGWSVAIAALGLREIAPPAAALAPAPAARSVAAICANCGVSSPGNVCAGCGATPLAAERWALQAALGHGTSGTTWSALDERGQRVAVKEMRVPLAVDESAYRLAVREAEVLRQLDHPGIPKYFGHVATGTGKNRTLWLAMEQIDGQSLQAEMDGRRYSPQEVKEIVDELATILDYLHSLSPPVVHRDLKLTNVLRRKDGRLVLIDFGSVADRIRTIGGTVTGTFGYMAPEQFAGGAGPASDYYSLGALAASLITRKPPQSMIDGQQRLRWREHASVDLPWLDGLLEPDPARRVSSLTALSAVTQSTAANPRRKLWPFS